MKTSMWASCCGLLNDLIGSGAVQTHQAGFGGGAGPFRFAPGAGFSPYPSTSSTQSPSSPAPTNGTVCKACGLAFSVLRKKYVCLDCGRSFCTLCCVLHEDLCRCCVCHLLWATAFERARLMRLRVRDLRRYLMLHDISTDACTEKEELVELVLRHSGVGLEEMESEEESEDTDALPPALTTPVNAAEPDPLQPNFAPQEDTPSTATHSETREDHGDVSLVSLVPLDSSDHLQISYINDEQCPPVVQTRARASLSDLSGEEEIPLLSVRQLKEILARNFVSFSGCCEKWELVERVHRLYLDHLHNDSARVGPLGVAALGVADDNMCRICMDAVIDCVLLECGHMITCTNCGKKMNECPICRQYVVRSVHVFRP